MSYYLTCIKQNKKIIHRHPWLFCRSVWKDPMCLKVIWKMKRGQLRHWTKRAGFTQETLENGYLCVLDTHRVLVAIVLSHVNFQALNLGLQAGLSLQRIKFIFGRISLIYQWSIWKHNRQLKALLKTDCLLSFCG